ncbi:CHAP domain-containing protein [Acinetobacter soli]|uniref:CHAP domain-containing protein n=1 Tax=Acinetobacter soli TaxID=487316 RepID=UPI001D0A26D8|nr:CHAP domain-containing protein [Acinetobacter soli]MCB8768327.1 CHAP domain-containing protein [Acinetobacter soli]
MAHVHHAVHVHHVQVAEKKSANVHHHARPQTTHKKSASHHAAHKTQSSHSSTTHRKSHSMHSAGHNKKHVSRDIDLHKFSHKLESISARHSKKKCARNIRIALQTAGADVSKHPVAASDWGHTLEKNGYKKIKPAFGHPQPGDIYIIQRTGDHVYGHIAGYTGNGWISDFRQKNYAVYKEKDLKYTYYRLES